MKKIISLLLTVAMLMSMLGIVATAEDGNQAVFFHGANVTSGNRFQDSYIYINDIEAVKRVNESGAAHYGGFNYTQVFDFKVTDYGMGSDHFTDFTFAHDLGAYHWGYSFSKKAFVVYTLYMPGSDPNAGSQTLASMSYDLQLDTWYEMAIRFVDRTITIYLNGVEMLVCDVAAAYEAIGAKGYIDDWDWTMRERPESADGDFVFLHMVDVDMYLDNYAIYSGDYDIATGTAEKVWMEPTTDYPNFNYDENHSFGYWKHSNLGGACTISVDPNGGTEKVTYDRQAAATHKHEWVLNTEKSSVQHCLVPGYDLYECANGCGASEQRNYVAPLGHLPGYVDTIVIPTDDENSGVEKRTCTRDGCGLTYTTVVPLTGEGNNALHMYTDGGTSVYNGQMGSTRSEMMVYDKGFYFEFDIMPIAQSEGKDFAKIGGWLGADYWVGYIYNIGKYVIKNGDEIIAESDKAFNNYEWQTWSIRRTEDKIEFYVDYELLLTADVDPSIYVDAELADCFGNQWYSPACESFFDNMLIAAPDFDMETRSGVVYSSLNFNDGKYIDKGGYIYNRENHLQTLFAITYNSSSKAGFKVEPYGRPEKSFTSAHQDRALLLDSDYESGSMWGYSQFGHDNFDMSKALEKGVDFEFSYDFYVYDWCTDDALLTKEHKSTDAEGNEVVTTTKGSAFIGGHVNSQGVGNANNPYGNGFAGYDFIKQAVVIGSVSEQAGGYYGETTEFTPYTVEKETWHSMTISYKVEPGEEDDFLVISVYMDGNLIASQRIESYWVDVDYFIFFPNFIKGYFDNITTKVNGTTYDDNVDFTNGFEKELGAITFTNGSDWSVVDGGKPTHVVTEDIFPASCETDGYTTYTCSCGESTYTQYNLPATGHNWDDGVVTLEPTGTSTGIMTYTCKVCNATKEETIAKAYTYGDVNDDGTINNTDLSLFKRFGKGAKVTINGAAADVNADGAANNTDISVLTRYLKGGKVTFG